MESDSSGDQLNLLKGKVEALNLCKVMLRKRLARQRQLPLHLKVECLLILFLSASIDLTMLYLVNYCESWKRDLLRHAPLWTKATLMSWLLSPLVAEALFNALSSRANRVRGVVDAFLLESLVAEEIFAQNKKGVVMPHRDVLFCYVQFASFLPDNCEVLRRVRYLVEHPAFSRQWGRYFRVRWNLEHNNLPKAKPLEGDDLSIRVREGKESFGATTLTLRRDATMTLSVVFGDM